MLSSKYSVDGQGSENEESDTEDSFENELSPAARRIHQSLIRSNNEYDESASSSGDKSTDESDQEIRSNLDDPDTLMLADHEKEAENMDSRIGSCSSSGKQPSIREGFNWCSKNKDPYSSHRISRAFLPGWVYRMFDSYWLAQRAAGSFSLLLLTLYQAIFLRLKT